MTNQKALGLLASVMLVALAAAPCRAEAPPPWPPQGGFTEWGGIFLPGVSVTPTNRCFHSTDPHTFTAKAAGGKKGGTYDWKYGGHSQTSTNNTAEFAPDLEKKPATLNVTFTPDGYPEASATGSATLGYCKRLDPPPEDDDGHEHDENCNPHTHWWCCKCGAHNIPDPELFPHNCDPSDGAGGGGTNAPPQDITTYLGSVPREIWSTHTNASGYVMFFPARRWANSDSNDGYGGTNAPPYVCEEEDCGGIHSYSCCDHAHGNHTPGYGQCCPCPEHNGGGGGGGSTNSPLRYITSYGLIVSTNPPPDITVLQNVPGGAIIPDGTPVWVTSNDPSTTLGDCWARFAWDEGGQTRTRDYTFTGIGMRLFPDRIGDNNPSVNANFDLCYNAPSAEWVVPAGGPLRPMFITTFISLPGTLTWSLDGTPGAFRVWSGDTTNSSTLFLECPGTATNKNPHSFPMHTGTVWVEALKGGSATFTAHFQGTGIASNYNVVCSLPIIAPETKVQPDLNFDGQVNGTDEGMMESLSEDFGAVYWTRTNRLYNVRLTASGTQAYSVCKVTLKGADGAFKLSKGMDVSITSSAQGTEYEVQGKDNPASLTLQLECLETGKGEISYAYYVREGGTSDRLITTDTLTFTAIRTSVSPDMDGDGDVDNTDTSMLATSQQESWPGVVYGAVSNRFHRVDFISEGGVTGMVYTATLKGVVGAFALYSDTNATALVTSTADGSSHEFALDGYGNTVTTNLWLECPGPCGTGTVVFAHARRYPGHSQDIPVCSNEVRVAAVRTTIRLDVNDDDTIDGTDDTLLQQASPDYGVIYGAETGKLHKVSFKSEGGIPYSSSSFIYRLTLKGPDGAFKLRPSGNSAEYVSTPGGTDVYVSPLFSPPGTLVAETAYTLECLQPAQGEITYCSRSQYPDEPIIPSSHTVKFTGVCLEVKPDMNGDDTVDNTDTDLFNQIDKDTGVVYEAKSNQFHFVEFKSHGGVTGEIYKVTLQGDADAFALFADTNATAVVTSSANGDSFEFAQEIATTNFWLECRQPGTGVVSYAYLSRTSVGDILITTNSVKLNSCKYIAEPVTFFPGNPAGSVPNDTASYSISVLPASLIKDIVWSNNNNRLTFQGDSTGITNVTVQTGNTLGDTKLFASIKGLNAAPAEFNVDIMALNNVTVSVIIVGTNNVYAFTEQEVRTMIANANPRLRRGGVQLVVGTIAYTNNPTWFNVSGTSWFNMRNVPNPGNGLKVFFVNTIDGNVTGFNNRYCMVISKSAIESTMAHETGHACGWPDIYEESGGNNIYGEGIVKASHMNTLDWGTGYYAEGLELRNIIPRFLMYGYKDAKKGYIPHGDVQGVYNKSWDNINRRWVTDTGKVKIGLDSSAFTRQPKHDDL